MTPKRESPGARRLAAAFRRARSADRAALIPYVTAGDPVLGSTADFVLTLIDAGADIVEIGLAHSDPLADGPTLQRSGQRALAAGASRRQALAAVAAVRARRREAGLVLLAYYNTVYRTGEERFAEEAANAGADGLIVPDLPPEEAGSMRAAARRAGVALIPLVAPTTPPERIEQIGRLAEGFVYCVSVTGVTGPRRRLAAGLPDFVSAVRRRLPPTMPVALGFGIAEPAHARTAARLVDGVIVGSALVQQLEQAGDPTRAREAGAAFVGRMRRAVERGTGIGGDLGGGFGRRTM